MAIVTQADFNKYQQQILINEEFITIKDEKFPPEACHPTSSGRFHYSGQDAYYTASGVMVAKIELDLDVNEDIPNGKVIFQSPPVGIHYAFDL